VDGAGCAGGAGCAVDVVVLGGRTVDGLAVGVSDGLGVGVTDGVGVTVDGLAGGVADV